VAPCSTSVKSIADVADAPKSVDVSIAIDDFSIDRSNPTLA